MRVALTSRGGHIIRASGTAKTDTEKLTPQRSTPQLGGCRRNK
jgi:hypothetical protein